MTMPTLCARGGPLPERYRPFLNAKGDLQIGDAFGLEAQWCIDQMDHGAEYPEAEWSLAQCQEDAVTVGCVRCGDPSADSDYGLCGCCQDLYRLEKADA